MLQILALSPNMERIIPTLIALLLTMKKAVASHIHPNAYYCFNTRLQQGGFAKKLWLLTSLSPSALNARESASLISYTTCFKVSLFNQNFSFFLSPPQGKDPAKQALKSSFCIIVQPLKMYHNFFHKLIYPALPFPEPTS